MQSNYITISLGLQDFPVLDVEETEEKIEIEVVRKWDYAVCPCCSHATDRVHQGSALSRVEDLPIQDKKVILKVHKCRFVCSCCGKVFTEAVDSIAPRRRRTARHEQRLYQKGRNLSLKELSL